MTQQESKNSSDASSSDSEWETVARHFHIEASIDDKVTEIADREGRKAYELMREALAEYIREKEEDTLPERHETVPEGGNVMAGDFARDLNFVEMWNTEKGRTVSTAQPGDTIRAIEPGSQYFDYYQFTILADDEYQFKCQQAVRFAIDRFSELYDRVEKHYIDLL